MKNNKVIQITPSVNLLGVGAKNVEPPKPVVPKLKLRDMQETFTLEITPNAQKKIDHLLIRVPSIEWRGTMFYMLDGDISDISNLKVTVVDVYPQDIGNQAYTEYEHSEDYAHYIVTHPELMDENIHQGHIHSHHTMSAFFSGTDKGELVDSAPNFAGFVSLIVNHGGPYVAAIAIKMLETSTTNVVSSFKNFNGEEAVKTFTATREEEVVYAYYTRVEKPIIEELDTIIANLRKKVVKVTPKGVSTSDYYTNHANDNPNVITFGDSSKEKANVPSLFTSNTAFNRGLNVREQNPVNPETKKEEELKKLGVEFVTRLIAGGVLFNGNLYTALALVKSYNMPVETYKAIISNVAESILEFVAYDLRKDSAVETDLDYVTLLSAGLDAIDSFRDGDHDYMKAARAVVYDLVQEYINPEFADPTIEDKDLPPADEESFELINQ